MKVFFLENLRIVKTNIELFMARKKLSYTIVQKFKRVGQYRAVIKINIDQVSLVLAI